MLGNTLTTDAKSTGTQALGSVHKEEEDEMNSDDRDFILDILNYDMRPISPHLASMWKVVNSSMRRKTRLTQLSR